MTPMRGWGLATQLDLVRLDQRVGEQLLAHLLHLCASGCLVVGVHLEVDDLADARVRDGEAEMPERALDRLALRVEDPRLRPDQDRGLHPSTTDGRSRYASNGIVVSRAQASTYFGRVASTISAGISGPGSVQ